MSPLSIKPGVELDRAHPALFAGLLIAADLYDEDFIFTVTGGNEEGHDENGPHPKGLGGDLRAHHLNERALRLYANRLQARLGPKYRVLAEVFPTDPQRNHVHLDYIGG